MEAPTTLDNDTGSGGSKSADRSRQHLHRFKRKAKPACRQNPPLTGARGQCALSVHEKRLLNELLDATADLLDILVLRYRTVPH